MLANTTLLVLLLSVLLPCLAEKYHIQKRVRQNSLADLNDYRFLPPVASTSERQDNSELEVLDTVILASVDGQFHALSRISGQKLWSMSLPTGDSVPASLGPLVRTQHIKPDLDSEESNESELYIIEPQSGDIFVMTSPDGPLQRLPYPMARLAEMTPFSIEDEHVTRTFVAKKESSLLLVELETGRIKAALNSECPWDPFEDLAEDPEEEELDLDELDGTKPPKPKKTSQEIMIGRTDYHVTITTMPKDKKLPRPPKQHLAFSTYGPNKGDAELQEHYRRTADDLYIQPLPSGEVMAFKAPEMGNSAPRTHSPYVWSSKFKEPIVAVLDVVRSSSKPGPFVLLQPRPRLQNIYSQMDLSSESAIQSQLPNIDSAYVGIVTQTGALFAMSPETYPFMAFGFSDPGVQRHNLIDPPSGSPIPSTGDVDSITRARKLRELCSGPYRDSICFTGMHHMESSDRSRYTRLLEAAPSSSANENETASPPTPPLESNGHTFPGGLFNIFVTAPISVAATMAMAWFVWKRRSVEQPPVTVIIPVPEPKEPIVVEEKVEEPQPHIEEPPRESTPLPEPPTAPRRSVTIQEPTIAPDADDIEGEDSDREGDAQATPRRRQRRGRRAKKKKSANGNGDVQDGPPTNGEAAPDTPPPSTPSIIVPTPPPVSVPSLVVSETILGFGSHGTVVFRGSLQGRAVAVKRLLQDFVTLASREVSILQESDDHPNVIRYYYQEAHANFLYIALELCPASLADVVESPDQFRDISITFNPKRALRQITSGLRHLHNLKIIHRDIKPQNILIAAPKGNASGRDGGHRMLISDFGLCKKLEVDQTSFLPTAHGSMAAGTVGWRAPEILRGEVKLDDTLGDDQSQSSRGSVGSASAYPGKLTRLTKSVDIFALGCLFYYTLTNGSHPFGDRFEREVNILRNEKSLDGLSRFGEEGSEATDLIKSMLDPEAKERPDTTTCLLHPFFWDPGRRLTFLQDASDRFEIMCRDPKEHNLVILEDKAFDVVGNDWLSRLDKNFIENLGKFRKYDGRSVQDLLRALRNKKHHYQDLPDNVKRSLGAMPEGFLAYFTRRYPQLFLHVHSVVSSTSLRQESMFKSYFELTDS